MVLTSPPPPTAPESRFDQELLGKVGMSGKPELPPVPLDTSPPDASDFPQTEAEALALVRGEILSIKITEEDEGEYVEQETSSGILDARLKDVVFIKKENRVVLRGLLEMDDEEVEFRLSVGLHKFPHTLFEARR